MFLRVVLISFVVIMVGLCAGAFVYFRDDLATSSQIIIGLVALLQAALFTGATKWLWKRRLEFPDNRCLHIRATRRHFLNYKNKNMQWVLKK